ncbi:MAG: peptide deformylase [Acidobacteria bacterium]|nr:peptide deformylase [Acidobacteriota bacterium]MBI3656742.1 peptide deformylase [Acidobacteriota bacterium]
MLLPIEKYGSPVLRTVSAPIKNIDGYVVALAQNMLETMYAAPGVGLAAPQIGVNLRLLTTDVSSGKEPHQRIIIANPEIVEVAGEQNGEEGCLSIPDFSEKVRRPQRIVVKGISLDEKELIIEAEDLLARCFCHEVDHLNGIFFLDHLSAIKRGLITRKLKHLIKDGKW